MSTNLKLKIQRPVFEAAAKPEVTAPGEVDPLLSFGTESETPPLPRLPDVITAEHITAEHQPATKLPVGGYAVGALVLLVVGGAATFAVFQSRSSARLAANAAPSIPMGTVTIDSRPQGAAVAVGGVPRGQTPIQLSLPAGEHSLELEYGGVARIVPIRVVAGAILAQHVELATEPAVTTGAMAIESDPSGAQVRLDGTARGVTPLWLESVPAGEHTITISAGDGVVTRRVTVVAGATATVVASVAPAAGAVGGYATFKAPFELQVFEGGRLLGTTEADRLMLPAGRHQLELVNEALEFRRTLAVEIAAGRTSTLQVAAPEGRMSVNAQPWADVSLDGRPVGTTPLANIAVPIGQHELVFRHPELGERRRTVVVTASTPVRVGMDMRQ